MIKRDGERDVFLKEKNLNEIVIFLIFTQLFLSKDLRHIIRSYLPSLYHLPVTSPEKENNIIKIMVDHCPFLLSHVQLSNKINVA